MWGYIVILFVYHVGSCLALPFEVVYAQGHRCRGNLKTIDYYYKNNNSIMCTVGCIDEYDQEEYFVTKTRRIDIGCHSCMQHMVLYPDTVPQKGCVLMLRCTSYFCHYDFDHPRPEPPAWLYRRKRRIIGK